MFPSANGLRPASKCTLDSRNKLLVTGFQCSLGSGHQGSNVAQRPAPPESSKGAKAMFFILVVIVVIILVALMLRRRR